MTTAVEKKPDATGFLGMLKDPKMLEQVRIMCPGFLDPVQLFRVATTQYRATPRLQKCSNPSLMSALFDAAACGLLPDKTYGHLVPRWNEELGSYEAHFQADYKGIIMLGMRSGKLSRWRPEMVCEKDTFEHDKGVVITHTWTVGKDRGKPIAYYSDLRYKDTGVEDFEIIEMDEILKLKGLSEMGRKDKGPWKDHFNEQAKGRPVHRHAKRLGHILGNQLGEIFSRSDDMLPEIDITADVEAVAATEKLKDLAENGAPRQRKTRSDKGKPRKPAPEPEPEAESPDDQIPMGDTDALSAQEAENNMRLDLVTEIADYLQAQTKISPLRVDEFLKKHAATRANWRESRTEVLVEMAKETRE